MAKQNTIGFHYIISSHTLLQYLSLSKFIFAIYFSPRPQTFLITLRSTVLIRFNISRIHCKIWAWPSIFRAGLKIIICETCISILFRSTDRDIHYNSWCRTLFVLSSSTLESLESIRFLVISKVLPHVGCIYIPISLIQILFISIIIVQSLSTLIAIL